MIPYGRQLIDSDDIEAVVSVLKSDFLTQGPLVPQFERAVAERCGAAHAVAVNSATSALHVACLALGVAPGDRVWTTPITFVASANCARYCGATVDFVDIDPSTYNMSVEALAKKLDEAAARDQLPKVVIPVHFAGLPPPMSDIHALGEQYGFRIIEDASHAIGGRYLGSVVGDCRYSDITIFSFHPVKIMTTGEGGLATTQSAQLASRMAMLRSHGITRSVDAFKQPADGPWYYEQHALGFNYRMTDIQAALGLSQLRHVDDWIARRHAIAGKYDAELKGLPLRLAPRSAESVSAFHLYVVQVDTTRTHVDRKALFERLRARGIGVNVHYIPVHTQPDYRALGFRRGQFPVSEDYYTRCLSLPIFAALGDSDQDMIIGALKEELS